MKVSYYRGSDPNGGIFYIKVRKSDDWIISVLNCSDKIQIRKGKGPLTKYYKLHYKTKKVNKEEYQVAKLLYVKNI